MSKASREACRFLGNVLSIAMWIPIIMALPLMCLAETLERAANYYWRKR
ncbi:MAG: hypothetical protein ABIG61_12035 [Planctomycetota bacterium]